MEATEGTAQPQEPNNNEPKMVQQDAPVDDAGQQQPEEGKHQDPDKANIIRGRSNSEGAHSMLEYSPIFPSLPDTVLEKMKLLGDGPRERLTEDEVENKYTELALSFTIDALTLQDRRERQKRHRDQAEDNIAAEVAKLTSAVNKLAPLCVDAETTELVTSILNQINVVLQATNRVSSAAEVFGSVQQEWRISEAVNLMLNHVANLKQQRDLARRQLQCTKRMLQDTTNPSSANGQRQKPNSPSKHSLTQRRASIAAIPRLPENGNRAAVEAARPGRRLTGSVDLSPRIRRDRPDWPSMLTHRSSSRRLELNMDLVNITENSASDMAPEDSDSESTALETPMEVLEKEIILEEELPKTNSSRLTESCAVIKHWTDLVRTTWLNDRSFQKVCYMAIFVFFCICVVILSNMRLEREYARRDLPTRKVPGN